MSVNWEAIAALAGVAAVVATVAIAVLQTRKRQHSLTNSDTSLSKNVRLTAVSIKGDLPESMRKPGDSSSITAELLTFENESGRDLNSVRMRVSPLARVWSYKVTDTKHLAREAVKLTIEDDSMVIAIDEFPSDEKLSITLISNDFYFGSYRVKTENASIKLINASYW